MNSLKQILFLGTASGAPHPKRNVSGMAITTESGVGFLVDCGEGTQHQLLKLSNSPWRRGVPEAIFITHLHGDHVFGLPGLLASFGMRNGGGGDAEEQILIRVFGPPGLQRLIDTVYSVSQTHIPYKLELVELPVETVHDLGIFAEGIRIRAVPIAHRVPAFAYHFQEPDKRGSFDVAKASALGIEKKMYKVLAAGNDVQRDDGSVIRSAELVGPSRPGRSILICQDTCNSDRILDIKEMSPPTILIHEATYTDELRQKAIDWGHSTAAMAADFAKRVGAQHLVLSHFSSRYATTDPFVEEARATLTPEFGGEVIAAHDFMRIQLGKNTSIEVSSAKQRNDS